MESSDPSEPIDRVETPETSQGADPDADASDSVIEEKFEPGRGRKLRIALLALNLALYTFGFALKTAVVGYGIPLDAGILVKTTMGALQMWHLAPLLLTLPLAAWGPWPAWQRGLFFVGLIIAAALVRSTLADNLGAPRISGGVRIAEFSTAWLVIMVPAVLSLALVGSFLRLRIGPPELPPIRLTILSMMIATAVLGVLVTVAAATRQAVSNQSTREYDASTTASERLDVLAEATIAGPFVAVLLGCVVASTYYWWARLLLLVIIGGYFVSMLYAVFRSAPQFPGMPYSFAWVYVGSLIGVAITVIWMVVTIRLLERSGWPCSRRNLTARQS